MKKEETFLELLKAQNLKTLSLQSCSLSYQSCVNIIFLIKNIERLNLRENKCFGETLDIKEVKTDEILHTKLSYLNLSACSVKSLSNLLLFWSLEHLQDLRVSENNELDLNVLKAVIESHSNIKKISIGFLFSEDVEEKLKLETKDI